MSSVTSAFAQVDRRIGYFRCIGDVSGYTVAENATNNTWTATVVPSTLYSSGTILEDMGEIAKFQGSILRKVRVVTQVPAGGAAPCYFIVLPGGEYPIAGYGTDPAAAGLTPAAVARLG